MGFGWGGSLLGELLVDWFDGVVGDLFGDV